ncbi:related to CCC2-copper resistance-associated P-type ATPase [Sporisorium reilianum SRZ2]|uniref:Related to CCC2-copper resistance-associated P-type ATPase n=1 Tax=Sporisorium reilianum (strain SRZ2) TaxID=999809 RepID=E6ZT63_SPORE|nr:related to CCC2-copper resistance-associated P-type ATPase [Sporisorium reilianum SRZ2]
MTSARLSNGRLSHDQERVPLLQDASAASAPRYSATDNIGDDDDDAYRPLVSRAHERSSLDRSNVPSRNGHSSSDLVVRIQAVCPNIHCPSCISHLSSLVSGLAIHHPHTRIGTVDTSLIDRSVNFDLVLSASQLQSIASTSIGGSNPARSASRLVKRIVKEVALILAQDGFPVDHARTKLVSATPSHRRYKDALTFVLDAPDLYEKESGTPSPSSLPNHAPTATSHEASKSTSILGHFPSSLGSSLRNVLSRSNTATRESARLQQERWRRHLEICQACRDDVARNGDKVVATLSIGGMTCASCAQSITTALQADASIPIDSIQVNVMSASATVTTHPSVVEKVVEAIEDAGFEAQVVKTEPVQRAAVQTAHSNEPHRTAKLSIQGMTCASCVRSITSALQSYSHQTNPENDVKILETSVNLMAKSADIKLSTEAASSVGKAEVEQRLRQVVGEIEDIGFDAELISVQHIQRDSSLHKGGSGPKGTQDDGAQQRSVRIRVDGMFCHHCVTKVRKYFEDKQQDHAADIEVNGEDLEAFTLSKPFLNFSYTSGPNSNIRLRDVIAELNQLDPAFEASFAPPASLASRSAILARKELRDLLIRLSVTAVFAVPSLVISMIAPVLPPDHPLRRLLSQYVVGSATRGEVAMWIISTPVQFGVGSIFFKKAWRSLASVWKRGRSNTDRFLRFGNMDVLVALGTLVAYTSSLAFLIIDAFRPPSGHSTFKTSSSTDKDGDSMPDEMGMTYFEVSVFLVFFILLGRALESISKKKTGDAVADLGKMKPSSAYLVLDPSNLVQSKTELIDVDMLEIGDFVLVPCGASPPLDGTFAGTPTGKQDAVGLLDESSLSGEARPVSKSLGDSLFAGTINVSPTALFAQVGVLPGSCMIDDILDVVQESAGKKASIAQLADKITGVFVPVIVYLSLLVFAVWTLLLYSGALTEGWQARHVPHYGEPGAKLLWSLQFGISCLLVACPCGIGLAAPTSQLAGIGLASKHGILVNGGGEAFRAASAAARGSAELVVVFDKTGTITKGEAVKVTAFRFAPAFSSESNEEQGLDQETLLRCIDLVEQSSTHPYAGAVRGFVAQQLKQSEAGATRSLPKLVDVAEVADKGLRATFETGKGGDSSFLLLIGNKRLMEEIEDSYTGIDPSIKTAEAQWPAAANSVLYVGYQPSSSKGEIGLALAVSDEIRPEASWVISHLQQRFGAEVWMVSGDNEATAKGVASQVGIASSNVVAGVLPVQKKEWVERLQLSGAQRDPESTGAASSGATQTTRRRWTWWPRATAPKPRLVCFVGDGINDSPALSSAALGVALGTGSSIAHSSSDFILLRRTSPLLSLPLLLSLSRATHLKIWSNFAWAFVFNLCLVPVAAGALVGVGVGLGPALSGLAMAFSSTSVVVNSLTLRWWRPERGVRRMVARCDSHGESAMHGSVSAT